MKKTYIGALLASTALLSACQGGPGAISSVKSALSNNSAFSAISGQISELETVVNLATSSASLSALTNPTESDKQLARSVVGRIDKVISSWESYKQSMDPTLLAVKVTSEEWRQAEAVIKILKEDLRPVVANVQAGQAYDTKSLEFLNSKASIETKITEKKTEIFNAGKPTVISASTSSVTVATGGAVNSAERIKSTEVNNGEQTVTGGSSISDLVRTATWIRTTTKNMEYDRTWTITVQNITTTVFSDGTTSVVNGDKRDIVNKQTFDAAPQVTKEQLSSVIGYTVTEQNDPTTVVTRGETVVTNVYEDRNVDETQADGSILHKTIRKTTTTKTTPITTTKTYPKISVYNYADGHSFTNDATDEIVSTVEEEKIVEVSEDVVSSTTEHVVKQETVTNEVVTEVSEGDPVFNTTYEDKTTTATADGKTVTTVTRFYTQTATVITTTTTKTTPVTKKIWTDGREELIRGETVVAVTTANTVNTDQWSKVMSETTTDAVAGDTTSPTETTGSVNLADMGTPTPGMSTNPQDFKTPEFTLGAAGGWTDFKSLIKADVAYSRGWTGKGSLIAIADTGYNTQHTDLKNAVKHTYNTLTGVKAEGNADAGMQDKVGHGSHVLGIAAGRRDGTGMHGVAFDADVAVVKVTDTTGYSFTLARQGAAWAANLGSIAYSVSANYASDSALRSSVVVTGDGTYKSTNSYYGINGYNGALVEAKQWATALGSEQVLVNSAGNENRDYVYGTGQMATATENGQLILGGRMLVVGNWDQNNNIVQGVKGGHLCTTYNETTATCMDAASMKDFYILAPGMSVQSASMTGTTGTVDKSGTSMAAPQVTGALAILHQMWPHMKGENLVKLVTTTASKDLPGYNPGVHGSGLLDLDRATQPVGATGIPTSGRTAGAVAELGTLSGGAALGTVSSDAFTVLGKVMVLDSFERDYTVDLNNTQKVDTRPGGFVEGVAFAADDRKQRYDGYANLAGGNQNLNIPEIMGLSFSVKMDQDASGDYAANINYAVVDNKDTRIDFGLGFVQETKKFLNNIQQGYMGVGEGHNTNYVSLNIKHNFTDKIYGFGNYQLGMTDVTPSQDFSLIKGYSSLISDSWGIGVGFKPAAGWAMGATYSQPLSITSGRMNYKVPTGRTLDGQVLYNEGSADASTKVIEHDAGIFVKYTQEDLSIGAFGERRFNVAGTEDNNVWNLGVRLNLKF